ncbi:MAG: uncharacterized protein QOF51_3354 [Chloroflexota bacterium]|jgi:predicted MPP superfamily phosphohydrolase|nr:uncharacterized protein [Chloroflexota bacterium]
MIRKVLAAAAATGVAGLAVGLHSMVVAPRELRVRRRRVAIPGLPSGFENYQILHISDTHLGALGSGAEQVLAVASLRVDLVVHTGDMIESGWYSEACAQLLGTLRAPDGVACVLGNHDYVGSWLRGKSLDLVDRLEARGVSVLINAAQPLERDGDQLWLVGLDDPYRGRPDAQRAFANVPADAVVLLLAHSPDSLLAPLPRPVSLAMTGHTHGGQVRTPWGALITRTRQRYRDVIGMQTVNGTRVHMSAGLGSTIPIRFLCPPEATVLHLTRAP